MANQLLEAGANVSVHDPVAMPVAKALLPGVAFEDNAYEAAEDADCLVICTEWQEYATADLDRLRSMMAQPASMGRRTLSLSSAPSSGRAAWCGLLRAR